MSSHVESHTLLAEAFSGGRLFALLCETAQQLQKTIEDKPGNRDAELRGARGTIEVLQQENIFEHDGSSLVHRYQVRSYGYETPMTIRCFARNAEDGEQGMSGLIEVGPVSFPLESLEEDYVREVSFKAEQLANQLNFFLRVVAQKYGGTADEQGPFSGRPLVGDTGERILEYPNTHPKYRLNRGNVQLKKFPSDISMHLLVDYLNNRYLQEKARPVVDGSLDGGFDL